MGSEFAFGVGKHGFEKDPKFERVHILVLVDEHRFECVCISTCQLSSSKFVKIGFDPTLEPT